MVRASRLARWVLWVFLAIPAANPQAATWTFTPELKRLDAHDNELDPGLVDVARDQRLRVGLFLHVATDGVEPLDDSNLGFESLDGAIHFSSPDGGLQIADIGSVVRTLRGGSGWLRRMVNTTFPVAADGFLGPPEERNNEDGWIFFWDVATHVDDDPRGTWCTPVDGTCTVFLGVLVVDLAPLDATARGVLSLSVGGVAAADDSLVAGAIYGRAEEHVLPGNTVSYGVCPDAGCPPALSFEADRHQIAEGEEQAVVVLLSEPLADEVTVPIAVDDASTAPEGSYRLSARSLTFAPDETARTFAVTAVANDEDADVETVSLVLAFGELPDAVRVGDPAISVVDILDDDDPQVAVAFGASRYVANEGGTPALVTVQLDVDPERELVIPITSTPGDGATTADYEVPASITLAPSETSATFELTVVEEDDRDGGESVRLAFGQLPPRVAAVDPAQATVSLRDNDADRIALSVSGPMRDEADGELAIPVKATLFLASTGALARDLGVPLELTGTASPGRDYAPPAPPPVVTFASGSGDGTIVDAVLALSLTDDAVVERDETVVVGGSADGFEVTPATVTITDDDTATVSVTGPGEAIPEGGEAGFTVTLSDVVDAEVVVSWSAVDGTATVADDIVADSRAGTVAFASNSAAGAAQRVVVSIADDDLSEAAETFALDLVGVAAQDLPRGRVVLDESHLGAEAVIAASGGLTVSLTGPARSLEGTTAVYTVSLVGGTSTAPVTVVIALGASSTADGDDHTGIGETVVVPAGQSSATFSIDIVADGLREGDETLVVELKEASGGGSGVIAIDPAATAVTTVLGEALVARMASASAIVEEGHGIDLSVTVVPVPEHAVTVTYALATGGAVAADYEDANGGSITVGAGRGGGSIRLSAVDDDLSEGPESFLVTLTGVVSADADAEPAELSTEAGAVATEVTIAASDPLTVSLAGPAQAVEGTAADYTLGVAGGTSTADVTATLAIGAASTAGSDDFAGFRETVTIAAGQSAASFSIDIVKDDVREEGEVLVLELGSVAGGGGGGVFADADADSVATTLRETPVVRMQSASAAVDEGDTLEIVVTAEPAPETASFTVSYSLSAGSADAGDYADLSGGSVTIGTGEDRASIRVEAVDDVFSEPPETFSVVLVGVESSDPSVEPAELAAEVAHNTTQGIIAASDPLTVSLDGPEEIREGNEATFTVSVGGGESTAAVTAAIRIGAGSQAGAADLGGLPDSVAVPAGQTTASFVVEALNDDMREGEELLVLTLADLAGGGGSVTVDVASVGTTITEVDLQGRARAMTFALAGFGRTLGEDVVEMVDARADARHAAPGNPSVTFGGRTFGGQTRSADAPGRSWARGALGMLGVDLEAPERLAWRVAGPVPPSDDRQRRELLPDPRRLLSGSAFELPLDGGGKAGGMTLWGRADVTRFDGRPEDDFAMHGEVLSGRVGLDYRREGGLLAGVAVGRGTAEVDYEVGARGATDGGVEFDLTSVNPYLHVSPGEGLVFWGTVGFGQGGAQLTDGQGGAETDIGMRMAAFGTRREIARGGDSRLAVKFDAFLVRMDADEQQDLPSVEAEASRARMTLEGSRALAFDGGSSLTGSLEIGARVDGGDAESGMGAEVGAGLAYTHPGGLDIEARGHMLLAHERDDFEQWGASVALTFDRGARGEGLQLSLIPVWGGPPTGADGIWATRTVDAFRAVGRDPGMALQSRLAYGFDFADGYLLSLFCDLDMGAGGSRVLRFGTRTGQAVPRRTASDLAFLVELVDPRHGGPGGYRVALDVHWGF